MKRPAQTAYRRFLASASNSGSGTRVAAPATGVEAIAIRASASTHVATGEPTTARTAAGGGPVDDSTMTATTASAIPTANQLV